MVVRRGIIVTREVQIPQRKLTSAQLERTPLGKLLGYGHFRVETAGEEFVSQVRFLDPKIYHLVTDPDMFRETVRRGR